MNDSPLLIKSKAFALDVIRVCKELRAVKCEGALINQFLRCLLYTSPSPRDISGSRMPSSA